MKKIISLVTACSLTLSSIVYAEPVPVSQPAPSASTTVSIPPIQKPPNEPDVGNAISPMRKGQTAPFTGVLLSPFAAATVITELGTIDEKIKIEVDNAVGKCNADCEFNFKEAQSRCATDKTVLQASIDANVKRIKILEEEIKKKEAEQTNPYLWTGIGFAGGVAITVLTAFAISQATK